MPSRTAPTISPCLNASTPARRIVSWPKPRSALLQNFRFFADKCAEARDGLNHAERRALERCRRGCRSARSASSRRGTRRSCFRPGRLPPALAAGLNRFAGARRVVAGDGRPAGQNWSSKRGRPRRRARNTVHGIGEEAGKALDRASRHQGDRFRRRKLDRLRNHGAGRADP